MIEASAEQALVVRALLECANAGRSGVLAITGEPGGLMHLACGGVRAIQTPGAPGPDLILLRSGRIPEPAWTAAFTAAAASGRMAAELVTRRLIRAGELEAVLRVALADAMFAVLGGQVSECAMAAEPAPFLLPLEPPLPADWLLTETSRRLRVLSAMPALVHHDRDRLAPGPAAPASRGMLAPGQDEILALANGRRTARDMSFLLGRGVYSLTLELSGMLAGGLISVSSRRATRPAKVPAAAAALSPSSAAPAELATGSGDDAAPALPRRRQAGRAPRHAPADVIAPASATLIRLRNIFPVGDRDSAGRDPAGRDPAGRETDS